MKRITSITECAISIAFTSAGITAGCQQKVTVNGAVSIAGTLCASWRVFEASVVVERLTFVAFLSYNTLHANASSCEFTAITSCCNTVSAHNTISKSVVKSVRVFSTLIATVTAHIRFANAIATTSVRVRTISVARCTAYWVRWCRPQQEELKFRTMHKKKTEEVHNNQFSECENTIVLPGTEEWPGWNF